MMCPWKIFAVRVLGTTGKIVSVWDVLGVSTRFDKESLAIMSINNFETPGFPESEIHCTFGTIAKQLSLNGQNRVRFTCGKRRHRRTTRNVRIYGTLVIFQNSDSVVIQRQHCQLLSSYYIDLYVLSRCRHDNSIGSE